MTLHGESCGFEEAARARRLAVVLLRLARRFSTTPSRRVVGTAAATLTAALLLSGCSYPATNEPTAAVPHHRDFMFQINDFHTRNQGGQTIDMYFYYRYDDGLPDSKLPNYISLRDDAIHYMNTVDVHANPYWETLNAQLCQQLKQGYPIQAISCQMQVKGDLDAGVTYEPGYHSSVETIGDIEPLQIPGPRPTPSPTSR